MNLPLFSGWLRSFDSSVLGRLSEYELPDADDGLERLEVSRPAEQPFRPTTTLPSSCSSLNDKPEPFRSFELFGRAAVAAFSSGRYLMSFVGLFSVRCRRMETTQKKGD